MAGGRVTVRTFDVTEAQMGLTHGAEPTRSPLGLRGLRLSLSFDEVFQAQLRALLRAAAHGPLRIMFPVRHRRRGAARGADGGRPGGRGAARAAACSVPDVPIGIMIEVPSAALTIDLLAGEADFVSIGTNDLIQYCLAVDRTDDRVSGMYAPLHPAILRVLRHVARGARRGGLPVSVCGEMAADPVLLPLLDRPRPARVQHDAGRDSRRQTGRPRPADLRHRPPGEPGAQGRDRRRRRSRCWPNRWRREVEDLSDLALSRQGAIVSEPTRVEKPWGYELHWAKTDRYVGKLIHVNAGHALSLQYHNQKDETIFLWTGRMLFEIAEGHEGTAGGPLTKREMKPGEAVHVTPKTVHRMTAITDCDIFEVSTPELQDVVRLEDRYGRQS